MPKAERPSIDAIEVRDLRREEIPQAVGVLARGMRDNPLHFAAYGVDPEQRVRSHALLVRGLFTTSPHQRPIVAVHEGRVVGVTGVAAPGSCQPSGLGKLRQLPALLTLGPRTAVRVAKWVSGWAALDPKETTHAHLGPLGVDAHLQGMGIGSLIMREYCRRLDTDGHHGYLETDKRENVAFYQRFGFTLIAESPIIGVPNWFMLRPPTS
ncbi:GNAT family N-acetyltransferase [Spongiactinospora sp. TRM90649]|uniref:GNAT family N-acetyltransferase n=1 Tax=Spongiactinospora sp. TRM90649 TaxID=3031114 RepID=UPI0023F6CC1C|nr:GNAT family N-acetyltransferase [Spongiactinospora sp. TRM90649]MDF5751360.1 GNAT family N-acetyltransferase [Spongiactinospora sp. TRM90649]